MGLGISKSLYGANRNYLIRLSLLQKPGAFERCIFEEQLLLSLFFL